MATKTKTFYPGAHEGFSGNGISNATNPVGKGSSNTTYANVTAASKGTAYCYWPFDVSAIPENATIDSVSCVVGVMVNNGAAPFAGNIQLYSGSTAKGTASSLSYSTSKKIITLSVGTWTRAELNGIRLRTYLKNNGSVAFSLSFFGADLTVTYTYQSEKFMLKLGGAWHDIARVFKKVNGIWVEQTDLANVVDQSKRLVNGGEQVVELPEGYTRLEYIESTGSQYIDTGFVPNQDTRVVMDAQLTSVGENAAYFGARTSTSANMFVFFSLSTTACRSDFGTSKESISVESAAERFVIDKNKNRTTFGEYSATNTASEFTAPCNMALLAVNTNGTVGTFANAKLYSCQIYDNGSLVRNLLPCTNSLGAVGLYDNVNDVFYQSASGTAFIAPSTGGSGDATNLISFTIAGTSYQAEEGMTWGEWVASGYNTAGLYLDDIGYVIRSSSSHVLNGNNYVHKNTAIIAGFSYTFE